MPKVDITKWISIVITILVLGVTTVVWASSEHSDIEDRSDAVGKEIKAEIKQDLKDQYTPLHQFTKIESKIDNNTKKIDKIDSDIEKLDSKLDTLINKMNRGGRSHQ